MARRALLVAAVGVSSVTYFACDISPPSGNAMGTPPCDAADPRCDDYEPDSGTYVWPDTSIEDSRQDGDTTSDTSADATTTDGDVSDVSADAAIDGDTDSD
jgi:hypothetical protein